MEKYSTCPINKVNTLFTRTLYPHIARKINNVCIFSHDQITYDITVIDCSSNYRSSAIWADTNIRLK